MSAVAALRVHHAQRLKAWHERLARIYLHESDPEVCEQCRWALQGSRARGVTEAMLHHAGSGRRTSGA